MNNLKDHGEFKLEKNDLDKINEDFFSESLTEAETKSIINRIYNEQKILIDPHTAVAIGVNEKVAPKENVIVLSTAHPSKFSNIVLNATNIKPDLPESLKYILTKEEKFKKISEDLLEVQKYILQKV